MLMTSSAFVTVIVYGGGTLYKGSNLVWTIISLLFHGLHVFICELRAIHVAALNQWLNMGIIINTQCKVHRIRKRIPRGWQPVSCNKKNYNSQEKRSFGKFLKNLHLKNYVYNSSQEDGLRKRNEMVFKLQDVSFIKLIPKSYFCFFSHFISAVLFFLDHHSAIGLSKTQIQHLSFSAFLF